MFDLICLFTSLVRLIFHHVNLVLVQVHRLVLFRQMSQIRYHQGCRLLSLELVLGFSFDLGFHMLQQLFLLQG